MPALGFGMGAHVGNRGILLYIPNYATGATDSFFWKYTIDKEDEFKNQIWKKLLVHWNTLM